MEYLIIVTFIVAFLMSFFAYRMGIKDGISLGNSKPLEPIKNPLKKESSESTEQDKYIEGLQNILNYDGNPQKKEGE